MDALLDPSATEAYCRVCATVPLPGQLDLFEDDPVDIEVPAIGDTAFRRSRNAFGFPGVETSACGRIGFWRQASPGVFGVRAGVGPLTIFPDTNILIDIREEITAIEDGTGLIVGPLWSDRATRVDALRDLLQLWWWRDVRFVASVAHLDDARRPLSPDRRRAREAAVSELQADYFARGGPDVWITDDHSIDDDLCEEHARIAHQEPRLPVGQDWRWPPHGHDRALAQEAYSTGCHVFLTTERKILACHDDLFRRGLAVLSPSQLIERLDDSGELDCTDGGPHLPVPDMAALARLHGGFGL